MYTFFKKPGFGIGLFTAAMAIQYRIAMNKEHEMEQFAKDNPGKQLVFHIRNIPAIGPTFIREVIEAPINNHEPESKRP